MKCTCELTLKKASNCPKCNNKGNKKGGFDVTILDIAEVFDLPLTIKFLPNLQKWHVYFDGVEFKNTKEDKMLRGNFGSHENINQAVDEYILQIGGKYAVVNAMNNNRKEFKLPKKIENTLWVVGTLPMNLSKQQDTGG